ncbi:hypothetical protein L0F63_004177, partial [Massospora cicadina]
MRALKLCLTKSCGAFASVRFNSTASSTLSEPTPLFIEPTLIPEVDLDAPLRLGSFGELGLCNYTPVGLLEKVMEVMTVATGMPWWVTICAVTLGIRSATLPLLLYTNHKSSQLHNLKPEMDLIAFRLNRAKKSRDAFELQLQTYKLKELFMKHKLNPLSVMVAPLIQAPIMLSFFMALRAMAEAPVPGFASGGLLWFTDLTAADPYGVLPVMCGLGLLASVELGARFGPSAQTFSPGMRYLFRGLAVVSVPFIYHLPAAIFLYWVPSNLFSLLLLYFTSNVETRKLLKLPELIQHPRRSCRPIRASSLTN